MAFHAEYDDYWPVAFASEAERLRAALGVLALRIDHVGSTSIAGMQGKPVIDIQVSVPSLVPLEPLIRRMERAGYEHLVLPEPPVTEYPFFHRGARWPQAFHVHLCEAGGEQEWRHIAFRDWLIEHPQDRRAYAELKASLARDVDPSDPWTLLQYSQRKGDFVQEIERKARQAARRAR